MSDIMWYNKQINGIFAGCGSTILLSTVIWVAIIFCECHLVFSPGHHLVMGKMCFVDEKLICVCNTHADFIPIKIRSLFSQQIGI